MLHPFRDVRLLILERHRWSVVQKYRVLTEGLQVQQLMAFAAALKEELYAEGLVQGNFTSAVRHTHTHCGSGRPGPGWLSVMCGCLSNRSPSSSCSTSLSEYLATKKMENLNVRVRCAGPIRTNNAIKQSVAINRPFSQ